MQHVGLDIILLSGLGIGMSQDLRGDSDVAWIFKRDEGRGTVPEEMGIDGLAEQVFCQILEVQIGLELLQGLSVLADPQGILGRIRSQDQSSLGAMAFATASRFPGWAQTEDDAMSGLSTSI
jgi:hypothetical protein